MAERMDAQRLEDIRSRAGSVAGTLGNSDSLGSRFYARLKELMFVDLDDLFDEVDRLRKLESKIEMEIARNYQMLDTLRADYREALDSGREMMANQMSEHMARITVENKVLVKLHHGAE